MDIQILQETEQRINTHFEQLSSILLSPANYEADDVEIGHLRLYLGFLKKALQRPYNRVAHFYTFLDDPDGLMSGRMYPICYLSKKARADILGLYQDTEQLVATLAVTHSTKPLEDESHRHIPK